MPEPLPTDPWPELPTDPQHEATGVDEVASLASSLLERFDPVARAQYLPGLSLACVGAVLAIIGPTQTWVSFSPPSETEGEALTLFGFHKIYAIIILLLAIFVLCVALAGAMQIWQAQWSQQARLIPPTVIGFAVVGSIAALGLMLASSSMPNEFDSLGAGFGLAVAGAISAIIGTALVWNACAQRVPIAEQSTAGNTSAKPRTKQCADCAETVLAEARVCRFCGHRFAQDSASES